MFYLKGLENCLKTQILLSSEMNSTRKIESRVGLKDAYIKYLAKLQPKVTLPTVSINVEIAYEEQEVNDLLKLFGKRSGLNDLDQENIISGGRLPPAQNLEMLSRSLDFLQKNEPDLYNIFQLTINKIFFAESNKAGGGSSSGAIGVIWLNPRASWTVQDYCEFAVHELTHNLIFLDERAYEHYRDYKQIANPKNFAHSSILCRPRPLDKVIHSLIVALEVLEFRTRNFSLNAKTFLHPGTGRLIESCNMTFNSLSKIDSGLLTEHLWNLLNSARFKLKSIEKRVSELTRESHYASEKNSSV